MRKPAPVTIALIIICVVCYIPELLQISFGGYDLNYWMCVAPSSWYRPWEFITAIFSHGSLQHLAFNMVSLYWLGSLVEESHGKARFLIIFFVSGIVGNIAVALAGSVAVGASGAIFGLLGAAALLLYNMRQDPAAKSMFQGMMVMLVINIVNSFLPGISMEAHLGGLVGGVVCEAIMLFLLKSKAKKRAAAPKVKPLQQARGQQPQQVQQWNPQQQQQWEQQQELQQQLQQQWQQQHGNGQNGNLKR